jgi:phosphonate transport system ATP-binding protein
MVSEEVVLDVSHIGKSYLGGKKALNDIEFTAKSGELITVLGSSGAGKSTLMRCINRLIEPSEGTVIFDGEDISHKKRKDLRAVRRQMAMIFQSYNLVYRLTAIQNVLHGRLGYKSALAGALGLYSEEEKINAFKLLEEVGLGELAYRRADQLSGGQKQRVGIARALTQEPKIILCDEPIASLDPRSSHVIMDYLRRVVDEKGITCIVNLHQVDFALEYSDRIIGLREGRKVFEGIAEETTSNDIREIYKNTLDAEEQVGTVIQIPSRGPTSHVDPKVFEDSVQTEAVL